MSDFKIVTDEAYRFKVLSEVLNRCLKEANLIFTSDSISLRESDESDSIVIDVTIHSDNILYEPPAEDIVIGFTCQHLYKVLKRIGKKDRLTITRDLESEILNFNILDADKDRNKDAGIRIKDVPMSNWELPVYPKLPVTTIPASEFQLMCKEMVAMSESITVQIQKAGVMFTGGTEQLSLASDKFGVWEDDGEIIYSQTFSSKQFGNLAKLNGLTPCKQLKLFCIDETQPLMISCAFGSIGTFKACIMPQ